MKTSKHYSLDDTSVNEQPSLTDVGSQNYTFTEKLAELLRANLKQRGEAVEMDSLSASIIVLVLTYLTKLL